MGLFIPEWKSKDLAKALRAVEKTDEWKKTVKIVTASPHDEVRKAAIVKKFEQLEKPDDMVCDFGKSNIESLLVEIIKSPFYKKNVRIAALTHLRVYYGNVPLRVEIAKGIDDSDSVITEEFLFGITEKNILEDIAKNARNNEIRKSAHIQSRVPGDWKVQISGDSRYYSKAADNLFVASEVLIRLSFISPQLYYMVDTPDGTLGRDINGFFTEAPIKTKNIMLESPCAATDPVQAQSLTDFGDPIKNLNSVAVLKMSGQYAKLVLLMKCGKCGYEFPVETEAGDMERQCYNCGSINKAHRGAIKVNIPNSPVAVEV